MSRTDRIALFESAAGIVPGKIRDYTRVYHYDGEHPASEKLPEDFLNRIDLHRCDYKAGLEIDRVYESYKDKHTIAFFNKQLGEEKGHLVLKQRILIELTILFKSLVLLEKFSDFKGPSSSIDFFPKDFYFKIFKLLDENGNIVSVSLNIPAWYQKRLRLKSVFRTIAYAGYFLLYPYTLLTKLRWRKPSDRIQSFKFGFHVFDSGVHHYTPPFSINFLKNAKEDNPQDILLIAEADISKANKGKLEKNAFPCCYFDALHKKISVYAYIRWLLLRVAGAQVLFFKLMPTDGVTWLCGAKLLKSTIEWELFFQIYKIDQFVTFQEPGNIYRALLQRKNKSRTTFILLNCSYDTLQKKRPDSLMDSVFSFMVYDRMIASKITNNYFQRNSNFIKNYIDVGILPSDHAFKIKNDINLRRTIKEELGIPEKMRVIGFFDVSMGREHIFTFQEALELINDMQRLMASENDLFCIYKSRTVPHYQDEPEVKAKYNEFINNERVLFVNHIQTNLTSTHFMGLSDLVIGCFASSVGMEAVCGGVPALYYTPTRLFRDDSIIRNIPGFCANGYGELKKLTNYWLKECNASEFTGFQEKYIKRFIDSHCDGGANKRLESILLAKNI